MPAKYPQDMPQPVLAPPAMYSVFLTLAAREGRAGDVREMLADVPSLQRAVGFRVPEATLTVVVGIGASLWDAGWSDLPRPAQLHPFVALSGARHSCPSTPGDLFFHVRATRPDMCFELARQLVLALGDAVDVVDEVHGFRFFDERDLLGFVDGTENPPFGPEADSAALVQEGPYAGGSYLVTQKYSHDLATWEAISVEEQERVIGRTKLPDIELPDDVKPSNSHVALNTIEDADGVQHQIVRDNLPWGNAADGEHGTFFIAYAADLDVTEEMLRNMFLGKPEGNYDRILDFSTALTGNVFFVPPARLLEVPEDYLDGKADHGAPAPTPNPLSANAGSLGIGALNKE